MGQTLNTAHDPAAAQDAPTAQVRLLATTDLHMQLRGFDYVSDRPTARQGLAGIGSLIDTARAEAKAQGRACLLFDNGDLLQGTPMGKRLAQLPVGSDHPAVSCLNQLGYDALGLGNHDLDFGLPYLTEVARQFDMPLVATNMGGEKQKWLRKSAMLKCAVPLQSTDAAQTETIRIGVLSVLPPQTATWNEHRLEGHAQVLPATDCLAVAVPALRARGADLIVVLAHLGIGSQDEGPGEAALSLASVPGIDAMITGHTHRRFPGRDHRREAGIAPAKGTLREIPTIMPGHGGSDLGVLDLTLRRKTAGGWSVIGHVSSLRRNSAKTPGHPAVISATCASHAALRAHLSAQIGHTHEPLNNFFSLAAPSRVSALSAQAVALSVQDALSTQARDRPLLVAASAHTTGGREGPDHYLNIPAGAVQRRHLAGLDPYNNQIWVIEISGAALLRRLEHAARIFAQLRAGDPTPELLKPEIPSFNFETIYGIRYQIDPRRPLGQRIRNLLFEGAPIHPKDRFLLATDQFRAAGGAGFERPAPGSVVLRLPETQEHAFAAALTTRPRHRPTEQAPWSFACCNGLRAELRTSPLASGCLQQIAHLSPKPLDLDSAGFLRVLLTL